MFKLIAGPCVIESRDMVLRLAGEIKKITEELEIELYFKASFDKANRTSIESFRGLGMEKGLSILREVKERFELPVVTDIHEPYQAEIVAEVCDVIQIPAFLCRQTDLLVAAAETGKIINVKKAQFLAPWDMKNVIEKIESAGNKQILLCERGSTFGYNRLIVDMTSIVEMKQFGYPVVFDGTHSVQQPGANGNSTGGRREFVEYLCKAALAAGTDILFLEVHEDPDTALSDGANMIKLNQLKPLMEKLKKVYLSVH